MNAADVQERPFSLQPPDVKCQCVKYHNPDPVILEHHHIWPKGEGGPTKPENMVWICPTTHDSIHTFIRIFQANGPMRRNELRLQLMALGYAGNVNRLAFDLALRGYRSIISQSQQ